MGAYRFQFRPVLSVVSVFALAILIALGFWQVRRLEWKQGLIAQVETRVNADPIPFAEAMRRAEAGENMEYTPVTISGRIDRDRVARVFGTYDGEPGVYVFSPIAGPSGEDVFVNEGFAPQTETGAVADLPDDEETTVTGLFRYAEQPTPPASWFQPEGKSAGGLWFVRDPAMFAAETGADAAPYYIDRFAVDGRDWPKGGTTRLDFNNRHLEYALTWFGLAATLIGVWIAFSLKKRDEDSNLKSRVD
ncbi:MAG: hypothetical protein CMI63_05975 [Parvularcula sp.]|nr:hypothetical protein [Parvularcula sp.]